MRLLTHLELSYATTHELRTLLHRIYGLLPTLPAGSIAYRNALANLRLVQTYLARRQSALQFTM